MEEVVPPIRVVWYVEVDTAPQPRHTIKVVVSCVVDGDIVESVEARGGFALNQEVE